jgi:vancomycin resistance protein YoaR
VAETSRNGRRLDAERAARRLLAIATSPSRTGRIPLVVAKPELTTRQAKALGIRDRISTFTTYHAAGEPRVTNIHLAADILDGAIVMPGEEFSLNGRVGERTAERGFVQAPVIYEGRFTSDIGGGTSQLATTTFNAAFFAGFPFVEYQPHSYYISRYPMGREATVSFPKPDLRFVNDLDRPVLIVTSYTGSSITVDIWGRQQGRTVTATQPQVTSRSGGGFTVVVHRIVTQGDREVRRDTFTTFYRYG